HATLPPIRSLPVVLIHVEGKPDRLTGCGKVQPKPLGRHIGLIPRDAIRAFDPQGSVPTADAIFIGTAVAPDHLLPLIAQTEEEQGNTSPTGDADLHAVTTIQPRGRRYLHVLVVGHIEAQVESLAVMRDAGFDRKIRRTAPGADARIKG